MIASREGATTTAVVSQRFEFGLPSHRELLTPGVSMSDTRFSARRYMGLMGHLGTIFAKEHERALLICYGVGNTARSLLAHPGLARWALTGRPRTNFARAVSPSKLSYYKPVF